MTHPHSQPVISDDELMTVLRKLNLASRKVSMIRTDWKDGIDIDEPSYSARSFADAILALSAPKASVTTPKTPTWTPEQFWEYADGLLGPFVLRQMRDMLAARGLAISPARCDVQSATAPDPVMWVCLVPGPAPAGAELRIRAWTADRKRMESLRAEGLDMQALYTSPLPSAQSKSPAPSVCLTCGKPAVGKCEGGVGT